VYEIIGGGGRSSIIDLFSESVDEVKEKTGDTNVSDEEMGDGSIFDDLNEIIGGDGGSMEASTVSVLLDEVKEKTGDTNVSDEEPSGEVNEITGSDGGNMEAFPIIGIVIGDAIGIVEGGSKVSNGGVNEILGDVFDRVGLTNEFDL
jgi:hypothetical protein